MLAIKIMERNPHIHVTEYGNAPWITPFAFLGACVVVFALTFGFFALIDFLPESPAKVVATTESPVSVSSFRSETATTTEASTFIGDASPNRVIIDALDKSIPVLNPKSNTIAALDNALLSGVVRHPDSADFENTGTMFLLGHSSYLPAVKNKNYQAFNGIQKLAWGDKIRVQSADTEYVYRVQRVYLAKASTASVPLQWDKPTLILATCNSFGAKEDRFIVEALFVESRPIPAT